MFTEVVAQTSYYYVYKGYADQKVVILDDFDHANIGQLAPNSILNQFFFVDNKVFKTSPNFEYQAFSTAFPDLAKELKNQLKNNDQLELLPGESV